MGRTSLFRDEGGKVWNQHVSPVAAHSDDRLLSEPTLTLVCGNRSSWPHFRHWRVARRRGATTESNALWASFDYTESRLGRRERHVVGHYRLRETLESDRAKLFSCDASL